MVSIKGCSRRSAQDSSATRCTAGDPGMSTLVATHIRTCKRSATRSESQTSIRISIFRHPDFNMRLTQWHRVTQSQQPQYHPTTKGRTRSSPSLLQGTLRRGARARDTDQTRTALQKEGRRLAASTSMGNLPIRRARRRIERGRSSGRREARTTSPQSTLLQWTGSGSECTSTSRSRSSTSSRTNSQTIKATS